MKKVLVLVFASLFFVGVGNAHAIQLLANGGFESGLAGWIHTGNVVALNSWWGITATEGNLMAVMSPWGIRNSAFGQLVDPTLYDTVTISFDYNLKATDFSPQQDNGNDRLVIFLDGIEILSQPINDVVGNGAQTLGWTHFNQTYPVSSLDSGNIAFAFVLANTPFLGGDPGQFLVGYVDNVSVDATKAPVPEPATMSLLGLGILGLLGLRRKRA